ncbi:cysteine synthase A [Clostridiaceae bacterium OttesenSCG-928-D20]|nr:cysteine synthase A [Clostridiaceae bacterium OttesenSCG-928-D20]
MKIYENLSEIVGKTPLVYINKLSQKHGALSKIAVKPEWLNPWGSIKDRAALSMLEDARKEGRLKKGGCVIEATSGNTGIGICGASAVLGYRAIIVMPDSMSIERQRLMKAYGAELILTDGALGMTGAIREAERLNKEIPGSIIVGQFENPANSEAHYIATGREIFEDCDGEIDIFVSAVGSGGTITGAGRYLKEQKSGIKIVAVEPVSSAVLSGEKAGAHKLQGMGAGFIPKILDINIYDEIIKVSNEEAFETMRELATTEGMLCGISSGAAVFACLSLSKREENRDKLIVCTLADSGERYLSGM